MIELVTDERVISFDGKVLEVFMTRGQTLRFHVALIQTIELEQRRRSHSISIEYTKHKMPEKLGIQETHIAQAEQLIAAVRQAMTT